MDRKKWETAIRCLEVALHPKTSDDEVIAGVNGFRRTADGTPLSQVCRELAGQEGRDPAAALAEPVASAARLSRENLDLRRKLELEQAEQAETLRRLHEAEQHVRELSAEIRAAELGFADFRAVSAQLVDGLKDENFDLRGALERATTATAHRPGTASAPFRDILAAALGESPPRYPAPPIAAPRPHSPWTA
jgi:hypothetical protein